MNGVLAERTVLVLDTDPGLAELAARFVERETALTAIAETDPAAAIEVVEEGSVSALVVDHGEAVDGLAVLEQVRSASPDLPVVLHSETGSEALAAAAISAGVTDYRPKVRSPDYFRSLATDVAALVETTSTDDDRPGEEPAVAAEGAAERSDAGAVTDRLDDALFGLDEEWQLTYLNAEAAALFDRPREELVGRVLWDVSPTLAETNTGARLRAAMATGTAGTVREFVTPFDGWFESRISPGSDGISVLLRDVSGDPLGRRALANDRRLIEAAVDAVDDLVLVFDAEERLVSWNGWLPAVTGYSEGELRGMAATAFVVEPDRKALSTAIETASGDETATVQADLRTVDGEAIPYEFRWVPLESDRERGERVCVARDLSDRQRRERELERQNERLERFASVVSHDLRNPLSIATAYVEQAVTTDDTEPLEQAATALERMDTLISDLLTLAQQGQSIGDPEPVDVAAVARQAWGAVDTDRATLSLDDDLPTVEGDPGRLTQALENLFRNAIEHGSTDDGATVRVVTTPNGIAVEDDGPGIPAEDRDQVFERGYSTTEDGTGFGLAIVREVVEAHGWDVRATEGTNGGARFELSVGTGTLPSSQPQHADD